MALTSQADLAFHLRIAVEQWMRDPVSGPWDDVIDMVALIMDQGHVDVKDASRLDLLLRQTGAFMKQHDDCPTCGEAMTP
jgi:hypothetical protein